MAAASSALALLGAVIAFRRAFLRARAWQLAAAPIPLCALDRLAHYLTTKENHHGR